MKALEKELTRQSSFTATSIPSPEKKGASTGAQDWKAKKEEQARLRKKENDLKKCEERIAFLENQIARIDAEMADPAVCTQMLKLQDLAKEQDTYKTELEQKYEEWETLAE